MSTGAVVMLLVGAIGLWGGLAAAIWNYVRKARAGTGDTNDTAGAGESGRPGGSEAH